MTDENRVAELEARLKEVAHAYDVTFKRRVDLEAALLKAQEQVCSMLCPSIWKTGERPPHSQQCQDITTLLGSAVAN
jgi:hypothetical protein